MEKLKEAFTGKSKEERLTERETGHTAASMTPAHPAGATGTYAERGAYGAGGTEFTGGAAGGPAYGTAVREGGRMAGAGWQGAGGEQASTGVPGRNKAKCWCTPPSLASFRPPPAQTSLPSSTSPSPGHRLR